MDADHFDTLTRSLVVSGSRRHALALALSGALGVLGLVDSDDVEAHNALAACKKKSGKQKKKCLKKARAHNATHVAPPGGTCTRDCDGKSCGSDGCGGSCGTCIDGTCTSGQCICEPNSYDCIGRCCDNGQACFADECGACEVGSTLCDETGELQFRACGQNSQGNLCACVTSVSGSTTCVNTDQNQCLGCDADTDCQAMMVEGNTVQGVCVDIQGCNFDLEDCPRLCMTIGCA